MRHLLLIFLFLLTTSFAGNQSVSQYDLVIYGGTAAAVTAAVQAKGTGRQSARACVRFKLAHRLWQHPYGAGLHDFGAIRRYGGRAGDRWRRGGSRPAVLETERAFIERRANSRICDRKTELMSDS